MIVLQVLSLVVGMAGGFAGIYSIIMQRRDKKAAAIEGAEHQKREVDAVYLALYSEIEHNRDRLRELWVDVTESGLNPSSTEPERDQRAYSLANADVPQWTTLMWQTQAPHINQVLDGKQIRAVLAFYANLERLKRSQIAVRDAQRIWFRGTDSSLVPLFWELPRNYQMMRDHQDAEANAKEAETTRLQQYRQFERIALEILESDNPLSRPIP